MPNRYPLLLLLLILMLSFTVNAQTAGWKWGQGSRNSDIESYLVAADAASNVFGAGCVFMGDSTILGPYTLYDSSNKYQLFVTKMDSSGTYQWIFGTQHTSAVPAGMVTDKAGNLYLLGLYDTSTCTLGAITLTDTFHSPLGFIPMYFLAKFSPSGTVLWATNIAPDGVSISAAAPPAGLGVDSAGNVYATAAFSTPSVVIGSTTLTNAYSGGYKDDVFIVKYNSLGGLYWAKSFGDVNNDESVGIAVTAAGNFYIPGRYTTATNIAGIALIDSGNFLAKFDTYGNCIWAKNMRKPLAISAAATDTQECIYLTGAISSTIIMGTDTLTDAGMGDIFVSKFDSSGSLVWARCAGGTDPDMGYSIAVDSARNVWISGTMGHTPPAAYTITFNGHILAQPPGPPGDPMFMAEYDNCGNYLKSVALKSGGDDNNSIALDGRDNIYVCGDFTYDTVLIGPDVLIPSSGLEYYFVARYHYDHVSGIPSFPERNRSLDICENSSAVSVDSLLAVNFGDTGIVLTWALATPPAHGSAVILYSGSSPGGLFTPAGLTYTPAPGYYGSDSFSVIIVLCNALVRAVVNVTIDTFPHIGQFEGKDTVCQGSGITLANTIPGGTWSAANTHAAISAAGAVSGISPGTDTIIYTIANACGIADTFMSIQVLPPGQCNTFAASSLTATPAFKIIPNPNPGIFTVSLSANAAEEVHIIITNAIGSIFKDIIADTHHDITLQMNVPGGVYFIQAVTKDGRYCEKLIVAH